MHDAENHPTPVRFIEDKRPDFERVAALLERCALENHWANYGPVVRSLEQTLRAVAGVEADRAVIACSSGTAALNVLAGVQAMKLGRPLRWAVSAYGFFSSVIGPFADHVLIDCDERGMLDLDALHRVPTDRYDGVCVTNLFGLYPKTGAYLDFCNQRDKPVILDNAMGLLGYDRADSEVPSEIISLHHTKPWGFGEGGCIIVPRDDEPYARALINFGVGYEKQAARYACNAKMSDVAAAYILDRLEQLDRWSRQSAEQAERLVELIERAELPLRLLSAALPPGAGQVAFVASDPIAEAELSNPHLVLRKYYRPPYLPWPPRASDLYARIVNLPCHAEIASLPDSAIVEVLQRVVDAAPRGA